MNFASIWLYIYDQVCVRAWACARACGCVCTCTYKIYT